MAQVGGGEEDMDMGGRRMSVRAYLSWFNFKGADQQKPMSALSGGERNRLHLAKVQPLCPWAMDPCLTPQSLVAAKCPLNSSEVA